MPNVIYILVHENWLCVCELKEIPANKYVTWTDTAPCACRVAYRPVQDGLVNRNTVVYDLI